MKTSKASTSRKKPVNRDDWLKGVQVIGLPAAIRAGQPAHETIEKLVTGYLSKGELRKDDY
jgi:hypothetical protein